MTNYTEKNRNKCRSSRFQRCPLSRPHYTGVVSYRLLYMNRVQRDCYLYTRRIKTTKKQYLKIFTVQQM